MIKTFQGVKSIGFTPTYLHIAISSLERNSRTLANSVAAGLAFPLLVCLTSFSFLWKEIFTFLKIKNGTTFFRDVLKYFYRHKAE